MPEEKRAFYEYHSALQEPWDGPASISFSDGNYIGAVLDRNGLRPSRYYITKDDKVVMASEVGVLAIEPEDVLIKGRLQPGRMFLVDFEKGRIVDDGELKHDVAKRRPYREWLSRQRILLNELPEAPVPPHYAPHDLLTRMQAFGYTTETMGFMLIPLLHEKKDPIGSMGNDAALECLSDQPRMLYDYFKQLFAQVTNPGDRLDPRRHHHVAGVLHRARGQPARNDRRPVSSPGDRASDPHECRAGLDPRISITAAGRPRRSTSPIPVRRESRASSRRSIAFAARRRRRSKRVTA